MIILQEAKLSSCLLSLNILHSFRSVKKIFINQLQFLNHMIIPQKSDEYKIMQKFTISLDISIILDDLHLTVILTIF